MKLTKSQLKEIIKEVITEEQKFYARKPDSVKISVFKNKDNWKKAIKGGYSKVDPEKAEFELQKDKEYAARDAAEKDKAPKSGQAPDKPQAKPKVAKIAADPFDTDDEPTKPVNKYKMKRTTLDVADELALDFEDNYGDTGFDDYMEYGFSEPPQHVQDMLDELPAEQANAVMDKVANMLYKKYGRHEESIASQLKREFKQYNNINKNITRG